MGQWGESMFESDGVLDFLSEFNDSLDFSMVEDAIEIALESEEYIDIDDCYGVIASAEIVAAIKGNKSDDFPEDMNFSIVTFKGNLTNELTTSVRKDLKLVLLNDEGSELFELWEDSVLLKKYYKNIVSRLK